MDVGTAHVVAASVALPLGLAVLLRRKGDARHVALGRAYVVTMVAVALPALFVYDLDGRPGAFHVLAVVSLLTTGLGWLSGRRRDGRSGLVAHASFMTWSWIGVATAGLAQLANQQWPEQSPWPVLVVVAVATAAGALVVPRWLARELGAHGRQVRVQRP